MYISFKLVHIIFMKNTFANTPVFEKGIPVPRKGPPVFCDPSHTYLVGQPEFPVAASLLKMEIGDSCLLSNWASASVHYVSAKHKIKFQRQLQPNGTVRVWRIA
jgi:hypothetical protein